jgi:Arc/MetJ-type ribon-helix-helix transcriptional regulator
MMESKEKENLNTLRNFGDKAVGMGAFKSVSDVVRYMQAVEGLAHAILQLDDQLAKRHEMILDLNQQLENREPVRPE